MEMYKYGQGRQFNIPLSETQETIILHLLGITFNYHEYYYTEFTEETLKKLLEMDENPLKLSYYELKRKLNEQ